MALTYKLTVPGLSVDSTPTDPRIGVLLQAHNLERSRAGTHTLVANESLATVAEIRAQDMADEGYFGHDDPNLDPGKYWQILSAQGTTHDGAGENLAMNNYSDPVAEAMRGWLNSPGHRSNILDPDFTHVGFSIKNSPNGQTILVAIFARNPRPIN